MEADLSRLKPTPPETMGAFRAVRVGGVRRCAPPETEPAAAAPAPACSPPAPGAPGHGTWSGASGCLPDAQVRVSAAAYHPFLLLSLRPRVTSSPLQRVYRAKFA